MKLRGDIEKEREKVEKLRLKNDPNAKRGKNVLKNFCDDSDDDDGWPKDEEEGNTRAGFFSIKFDEQDQNGTDPLEEELLPSKHKLFKSGFHLESDGRFEENHISEK